MRISPGAALRESRTRRHAGAVAQHGDHRAHGKSPSRPAILPRAEDLRPASLRSRRATRLRAAHLSLVAIASTCCADRLFGASEGVADRDSRGDDCAGPEATVPGTDQSTPRARGMGATSPGARARRVPTCARSPCDGTRLRVGLRRIGVVVTGRRERRRSRSRTPVARCRRRVASKFLLGPRSSRASRSRFGRKQPREGRRDLSFGVGRPEIRRARYDPFVRPVGVALLRHLQGNHVLSRRPRANRR